MSTDPHRPTAAGADVDEVPTAPFAAPVDEPTSPASGADATEVTGTPEPDPGPPTTDWLAGGAAGSAAPGPDPVVPTPSAFTPPGTPEAEGPVAQVTAQATAAVEKPEVRVGLAFVGGAVLSLVLKRFGR